MSKTRQRQRTRSTRFICHAPDARAVFLAGTFNDWSPVATPLTREPDGKWAASVQLPSGRHEFKFVVDGQWCCDAGCEEPEAAASESVPNPFGTLNRVIEVK